MKKILMVGFVLSIMVCFAFAPMERQIVKAGTTVTLTFDPDGNVSLDVSPATFDFGVVYANTSESTGSTYFTLWNNGSTDNMSTTIEITTGATNFTIDEDSAPDGWDNYSLNLTGGTISGAGYWIHEGETIVLDDDLDVADDGQTFGLWLFISNITQNWSTDTIVCTLVGTVTY